MMAWLYSHADGKKLSHWELHKGKRRRVACDEVAEVESTANPRIFGALKVCVLEDSQNSRISKCGLVKILKHVSENHQRQETTERQRSFQPD